MADVCGPWTLEGLDNFGSLDSLPFSLDDAIWESAGTCILDGQGSVAAQANVATEASVAYVSAGSIQADGDVSAIGIRIQNADGSISAQADVAVAANFEVVQEAYFTATGSMLTKADLEALVIAFVASAGFVSSDAIRIRTFIGKIIADSGFTNSLSYKYGEEWGDVADESNVWTTDTEDTNTWTVATAQSDTWTPIAAGSNNWTEQNSGNNTWQRLA